MTSTERQKRLLEEFEQARTAIREFITSRSERERTALSTGATDQWSAGELLTAIGFWMDYMVRAHGIFSTRRDAASSTWTLVPCRRAHWQSKQTGPGSSASRPSSTRMLPSWTRCRLFDDEQLAAAQCVRRRSGR